MHPEAVAKDGHHQNALKISAGLGDVVHRLFLARGLQKEGDGFGVPDCCGGEQGAQLVQPGGQGADVHRVEVAFGVAFKIVPEFASAPAVVKNDQQAAPPPAAGEAAAAQAARPGQSKGAAGPGAREHDARVDVACFGQKKCGHNAAVEQAIELEQGAHLAVRGQADTLVEAQAPGHERPQHHQQGQHPLVEYGVHAAKGGAQQKDIQGCAREGQQIGQAEQGILRRKSAEA